MSRRVSFGVFELDANIGCYIFAFLCSLDRCMARSVCKEWCRYIPPQRLDEIDDFAETLPRYDRLEYTDAVWRYTSCNKNFVWSLGRGFLQPLMDSGSIYSISLWYRFSGTDVKDFPRPMWRTVLFCRPSVWETFLKPLLLQYKSWRRRLFWYACSRDQTDLMQWLIEHGFVSMLELDKLFLKFSLDYSLPSKFSVFQEMRSWTCLTPEFWTRLLNMIQPSPADQDLFFQLSNLCNIVAIGQETHKRQKMDEN